MFTQWYKGGGNATQTPPPSGLYMTIGGAVATGGYGTCYGYTSDPHYLGMGNAGALSYTYLRDIRDPANPKIVRIADIIIQQQNYLVLGWEPLAGVPDPSWPAFTWKMMVNGGTVYDFSAGSTPSISAPCVGRYLIAGNLPWNSGTVGQYISLAFV